MNKKIEHTTSGIELNYNDSKALRPIEEKMPDRYIYMHNFAKELFNDYNIVQEKYEAHDRDIKLVIARYKAKK